jgi:thiamine pyrophosphate-dependent acetolactate synthase large subunit-like protein
VGLRAIDDIKPVRPEDIRPALERAAKAGVPACVNVICDPAAKSETTRFSSYFQQQH